MAKSFKNGQKVWEFCRFWGKSFYFLPLKLSSTLRILLNTTAHRKKYLAACIFHVLPHFLKYNPFLTILQFLKQTVGGFTVRSGSKRFYKTHSHITNSLGVGARRRSSWNNQPWDRGLDWCYNYHSSCIYYLLCLNGHINRRKIHQIKTYNLIKLHNILHTVHTLPH